NVIAKELGMSAVTLNKKLNEKKVIYRSGGVWVPYGSYQDRGYARFRTHVHTGDNGAPRTSELLYWTQAGRAFIHQIMKGG
ncbi:MAG: phage antirepressor KilAC domain-containing protein, partial [Prevotellaceae bacterium]|nr:phage antirepressor KilAC domain-containing protein [Prevotellaceae bacterium]